MIFYTLTVLTGNKSSVIIQTSYLSIFDVNLFNVFPFPVDNWLKIVLKSFSSNKAHNVSSWSQKKTESTLHVWRMAARKDRESAVSDPFGESLIFCPKIPLGRLFSKINWKVSEILFVSEIREKLKLRSKCSFLLDQMSKIRREIEVSPQS